jgi:hypothetical protein
MTHLTLNPRSPDGSKIAFVSNRDNLVEPATGIPLERKSMS